MLKTSVTHPELIRALAACGHGDKVLIADGNYPLTSGTNAEAERIYLNLTHGIPLVTDVLSALVRTVSIEKAEVMVPDEGDEPAIFGEFRSILGDGLSLEKLDRFGFYDASRNPAVKVAIATGEQRIYANLLMTIGVVT